MPASTGSRPTRSSRESRRAAGAVHSEHSTARRHQSFPCPRCLTVRTKPPVQSRVILIPTTPTRPLGGRDGEAEGESTPWPRPSTERWRRPPPQSSSRGQPLRFGDVDWVGLSTARPPRRGRRSSQIFIMFHRLSSMVPPLRSPPLQPDLPVFSAENLTPGRGEYDLAERGSDQFDSHAGCDFLGVLGYVLSSDRSSGLRPRFRPTLSRSSYTVEVFSETPSVRSQVMRRVRCSWS